MEFDSSKDYYQILGVIPTADILVIKAAYKALATIYHPDKNASLDAAEIMKNINEAWSVLSDESKRKKYDEFRTNNNEEDIFGADESYFSDKELDEDWEFAKSYYPTIEKCENRLRKINWRLGFTFKALLIEFKEFKRHIEIADKLETEFLTRYFGSNKNIHELVGNLIFERNDKKTLREINKAIKILGESSSEDIFSNITEKLRKIDNPTSDDIINELHKVGYRFSETGLIGWTVAYPDGSREKINSHYSLLQLRKKVLGY